MNFSFIYFIHTFTLACISNFHKYIYQSLPNCFLPSSCSWEIGFSDFLKHVIRVTLVSSWGLDKNPCLQISDIAKASFHSLYRLRLAVLTNTAHFFEFAQFGSCFCQELALFTAIHQLWQRGEDFLSCRDATNFCQSLEPASECLFLHCTTT